MMRQNKHGLKRTIPLSIKRQLRQEAGFGCVICGFAIYDYEHIEPGFKDARRHDPDSMAVLCRRCHGNVSSGIWSKKSVWEAKANPKARRDGFANGFFDTGNVSEVRLGPIVVKDCDYVVSIMDTPVLWFTPPKSEGGPIGVNAYLRNANGEPIVQITENEWKTDEANWDAEASGRTLTFRDGNGNITLRMTSQPREALVIEKMDMMTHGFRLTCDKQGMVATHPNGRSQMLSGHQICNCRVGIEINMRTISYGVDMRSGSNSSFVSLTNHPRDIPSSLERARRNFDRTPRPASRKKVGRNAQCPCHSGKKFKHCCGRVRSL